MAIRSTWTPRTSLAEQVAIPGGCRSAAQRGLAARPRHDAGCAPIMDLPPIGRTKTRRGAREAEGIRPMPLADASRPSCSKLVEYRALRP